VLVRRKGVDDDVYHRPARAVPPHRRRHPGQVVPGTHPWVHRGWPHLSI